MRATAELAKRLDVRLHTHLAETEDENRFCLELYKCRPLDYLEDCGWLNERTWLAHGIHFNDGEIKRLARAGTAVAHCACSNQTLASGTCPVCAMEEAGDARRPRRRRLGIERRLESDAGSARRVPAATQPLRRQQSQPQATRCAGRPRAPRPASARTDIGEIAVGKMADLALFKLDELRFSGSGDPLAALVLCGAHRADRVMVGGRWIVENGQLPGLDLADLIRRHSAAARKLQTGS